MNDEFDVEKKEIVEEVHTVSEESKKHKNGKFILGVLSVFLIITIIFSVVSMKQSSGADGDTTDNVGEVYSNIIKTMAGTSSNDEEFSIKDIATLTTNSVVEINTETVVWGVRMGQYISEGAGSGLIISGDGYIVTNAHVIEDASKITVKLKNGETYTGTVTGQSSESDIAVIKIEATGLQPVVFGDSDKLSVGDTAVVVGNPLGSLGGTVTNGIISALDREIDLGDTTMNLLQTNAAVNPGNSGGGLFNGKGELVGIVTAKSAGSDIEGIGFAIPVNDVKEVISELKTYGYKRGRVQLGVTLLDVSDGMYAMLYRVDAVGVYVQSVSENSDAEKAGIRIGDRIVSIDGDTIKESTDVKKIISSKSPGDKVSIVVSRNGKDKTYTFELTEYKG